MYKKYAQDTCIIALTSLFLKGFAVVLLMLLTKGLGVALYGIWIQIYVTVSLLAFISRLGLNVAASRFLPAQKNTANISREFFSVLSVVFLTGFFLSMVLILFSNILAAKLFHDMRASYFIKLAAFLVLFYGCADVIFGYFRIYGKIWLFFLLTVSQALTEIAFVALALYYGFGLKGSLMAMLLSWSSILIFGVIIILKEIKFSFLDIRTIKHYFTFGLPLLSNPMLVWIILSSDRYIIGYFLDAKSVGVYSAAYRLGSIASIATSIFAIDSLLFIATSKLYDEGKLSEVKKYFSYSLKFFLMFTIPLATAISLLAKPLLRIFTSQEFLYGAKAMSLIAFAVVGFGLYHIFIFIPFLERKTKIDLILLSIAAVLNVVINIFLVPRFGIIGAALSSLLTYFFLGLSAMIISARYLRFEIDVAFVVKVLVASSLMGSIIVFLRPVSSPAIFLVIFLSAIAYFAVLFLLKGFSRQEIKFSRSLIKAD